jgi:hypothetical protein
VPRALAMAFDILKLSASILNSRRCVKGGMGDLIGGVWSVTEAES